MKKQKLTFYLKEPSLPYKGIRFLYGGLAIWSPAFLVSLLLGYVPWAYGVTYGMIGSCIALPSTRGSILSIHRSFWNTWAKFRKSYRVSSLLRAILQTTRLIQQDQKIHYGWDGRERKIDITTVPNVDFYADQYNYYLDLHMLAGQTSADWERKLDAFSHAFGSLLVSSKIRKGVVSLVLQHTSMDVTKPVKKTDDNHVLYIGYEAGGITEYHFDENPHLLISGVTSGGKSTFLRGFLSQFPSSWTLRIVDGKQVEFTYLKDFGYDICDSKEGFLQYIDDAITEMDRRYDLMTKQRKNHYTDVAGLEPYFLVCDEWISLVEVLPKNANKKAGEMVSERDRFFEKVKILTTKGRAAGIQLIGVLQRPDAEYLSGLVRDMFTTKVLLKGSKSASKMMFDDDGKDLEALETGQGYCSMMGATPKPFSFPNYSLEDFLEDLSAKHNVSLTDYPSEPSNVVELRKDA
ncbi:FtsK/SpoIIIE domain-containing protein [Baia soyae]|uniref:FtsK domain-containing protein n=1 Tax=Baia soyae TaxID=1544746 RepID=A0A4R2RF53_9BACL|nr:FtsK/SpoIIIE domain-containing protein [Baia soyae]TCP61244.1 hypothetical protein EDD57_16410 [Baia soyae]